MKPDKSRAAKPDILFALYTVLAPYAEHIYHFYVIHVRERNALQAFLAEQGIETGIHYPISMMFGLKL